MARKKRTYFTKSRKTDIVVSGKLPLRDTQQELFCVLYTSNTTPRFFGHGQNCYAEAYGRQAEIDKCEEQSRRLSGRSRAQREAVAKKKSVENYCRTAASRLLHQPNIVKRCAHLFDSYIKYEVMDREQVKVALQMYDLPSKIRAIELYKKERGHFAAAEKKSQPEPSVQKVYVWGEPLPRRDAPKAKKK